MPEATYLERTLYRLRAQYATLAEAVDRIPVKNGVVWEIGLGKGRSYDHLRRLMPQADIYAFDREAVSVPDCTPPADRLVLGELADTLPPLAARQSGTVMLVHIDLGVVPPREATRQTLERALSAVLAPGAVVASGMAISVPGAVDLPLPVEAKEGGYLLLSTNR